MNFEVFCINDGQGVVNKEYFNTYKDAFAFELSAQRKYDCVSVTPMNERAEREMREYFKK